MEQVVEFINKIVWNNALIIALLFIGVYFTIRTRFIQIRYFRRMIGLLYKNKASKEGVSSFQAFALDLSGRIGTGNIAGVGIAIAWGGPGAVFWMWLIAIVGAATAFAEATLGQLYKEVKDGEYRGGPAFYIEKGLGKSGYAKTFAITLMLANGLGSSGIQSNSIAAGIENAFHVPPLWTGVFVAGLVALVIFGGVRRISRAAQIIVPFMAIGYILLAIVIIGMNFTQIPEVLKLIFSSALGSNATFGGILGSAVAWGVRRGMFSNEAGQGTAPHASAAAEVQHPVQQGLIQAFSVYIDTLVVCTITAFIILFSGMYNVQDAAGHLIVENVPHIDPGIGFTQEGINRYFPGLGDPFVAVTLFLFAFTSILAIYYRVETNLSFLFTSKMSPRALLALRIVLLLGVIYGAYNGVGVAWKFGDIGVGLITWLNITALFLLRKPVLKALKDYEDQLSEGKSPVFNALKAGVRNAKFWEDK